MKIPFLAAASSWAAALALSISSPVSAADKPNADADWQKVQDAITALEQTARRAASKEEAIAMYKLGLEKYDAASKEFLEKNGSDSRRWKIRMFNGQISGLRQNLGLASSDDLAASLDAVLKADDADPKTKGEASGLKVILASEEAESAPEEWQKLAEAHLKAYPDSEANEEIKGKIEQFHTMAALKTKPLDLKFTSVDGHEVDISALRGKVILVDFWATWCPPCVGEVPHLVDTYEKLHSKGFEIIGISLDHDKDQLTSFVKEKNMTWPQFFDGKAWEGQFPTRFGIRAIPAMWLINKKGILATTNAVGTLEEKVEKLLAEPDSAKGS